MKIIHLIKKDLLLAGMYFVFAIMILLAVPIFLSNQTVHMSSVYILFISVSFACYFLFNNIVLMEDKYKMCIRDRINTLPRLRSRPQ